MPPNFIFPDWPTLPHIKTATTIRQAGNLALHVDDNPVIVQANRQKLIQSLRIARYPRVA
ncbi:hypothetical protein [Coxiella-like endosymbiont of Rhipicephalus sanguineus]|uniref:hypothetical protein n=1 Tax=Coxiella-like endosymbiont of Rhipicephalus sanguineus TaxID=1955402 RepID=UPI00203C28D6|nr:hypothetical protein [Coxiella-like endosymbiont of Rhipicephalus sanguineus]